MAASTSTTELQSVISGPVTDKNGYKGQDDTAEQDASLANEKGAHAMPIGASNGEYKPPYEVLTKAEKKSILGASLVALFLAALDQNIIVVSLPKMVEDLGGETLLAWVVASYMLTSSATMAIYGRLSDVYGRREVYLVAVAFFLLGSALCGGANTIWFLIIARGVQGVGGGGLIALSMIVVGDIVEPALRPKYLSALTSVWGLASVVGPLVGGGLTDGASWRWIFWINLPLGGIAMVALFFAMRKFKLPKIDEPLDMLGCLLVVCGTVCFVLWVIWGGSKDGYAWDSGVIIGLIVASIVLLALFILQELRHPLPILNMELFASSRNYSVVMVLMFLTGFSMLGTFVYLPIYFERCRHDSAVVSGLKLIPLVFGFLLTAGIAGGMLSKTGKIGGWVPAGAVLLSVGTGLCSLLGADTNFGLVFLYLVIAGGGMGIIFPVTTTIVQNSVPMADMANALSAYTFLQSMGGALGVAILGAILNNKVDERTAEGDNDVDASVFALDFVFAMAAIPAVITFIGSLLIQNVQLFKPQEKKTEDKAANGASHSNGHADGKYSAIATSESSSNLNAVSSTTDLPVSGPVLSSNASTEPLTSVASSTAVTNDAEVHIQPPASEQAAVSGVLSRDSVSEEDALV